MSNEATLERMAQILRNEIAPAVEDQYARTQAHMAAVVLRKLSREFALRAEHEARRAEDLAALVADLKESHDSLPPNPQHVLTAFAGNPTDAHLCALIESLYRNREQLGAEAFTHLLGRIRRFLRADIDRRLEYAE